MRLGTGSTVTCEMKSHRFVLVRGFLDECWELGCYLKFTETILLGLSE